MSYVRTSGTPAWLKHHPLNWIKANPAQNTWYTVLETTFSRLYQMKFRVDTTGETLEFRVTLDGTLLGVASQVAVAGTEYFVAISPYAIDLVVGAAVSAIIFYSPVDGSVIKIEMRKTTNAGNGTFNGWLSYGSLGA